VSDPNSRHAPRERPGELLLPVLGTLWCRRYYISLSLSVSLSLSARPEADHFVVFVVIVVTAAAAAAIVVFVAVRNGVPRKDRHPEMSRK